MTYRPHAALTMFLPLAAPETPAWISVLASWKTIGNFIMVLDCEKTAFMEKQHLSLKTQSQYVTTSKYNRKKSPVFRFHKSAVPNLLATNDRFHGESFFRVQCTRWGVISCTAWMELRLFAQPGCWLTMERYWSTDWGLDTLAINKLISPYIYILLLPSR